MSLLSREDILNSKNLKTLDLEVPELGGAVRIREMTAAEYDELSTLIGQVGDENKTSEILAVSASYALVDAKGNRLFVDQAGRDELRKLSIAALRRIQEAALTLNGATKPEMEKIEKN